MGLYSYSGPVINNFDICIADRWEGLTYAPSAQKARNNLAYRYKKENNLQPNVKIKLTGEITLEEE